MPVMPDMKEAVLAPYAAPSDWLVTARSYLVDRFVPDCEVVLLPPKEIAGGVLSYGFGDYAAVGRRAASSMVRRLTSAHRRIDEGVLIDLRLRAPENFAHFLNNHLPLVFFLQDRLGLDQDEIRLLLPKNTPAYITEAATLFGYRTVGSDDRISGRGVLFEMSPWTGIRAVRADWARTPARLDRLAAEPGTGAALPRKVFLSRRKTRALENAREVEAFLEERGFRTLYPEDLTVADQMRLFREAEEIVAIHGASLAPLLYVPPTAPLRHLVELMPCGHMTDVYRVMARQIGRGWIGVRGRIKPEYVAPAYRLDTEFKEFSLDCFDVDLAALARAFELVEQREG